MCSSAQLTCAEQLRAAGCAQGGETTGDGAQALQPEVRQQGASAVLPPAPQHAGGGGSSSRRPVQGAPTQPEHPGRPSKCRQPQLFWQLIGGLATICL